MQYKSIIIKINAQYKSRFRSSAGRPYILFRLSCCDTFDKLKCTHLTPDYKQTLLSQSSYFTISVVLPYVVSFIHSFIKIVCMSMHVMGLFLTANVDKHHYEINF